MFALIDCNNFYVSCERVFDPKLNNKPVVVLSNNDGCIISRSDEVKRLGIPMGAPVFKYRSILNQHDVKILSSNYPLYADMSYRVMSILKRFVLDVELYSIDEAFLSFHGFKHYNIHSYAIEIRKTIFKWTGIPTSVGIAPTKALSKIANKVARRHPRETKDVYLINSELERIKSLKKFSLNDVWGIGRSLTKRLEQTGCSSAYDFTKLPKAWIKSNLSIVEFRLQQELRGIATLRLDFIKNKMSGLLTPDVEDKIIGSAEILEIFKVSKVGKVAGSKVIDGEIHQNYNARIIRDGAIIFNGKIGSIFREKNQAKQVSAGLECGITLKDFSDFQKKDIIEAYNSKITERMV